MLKSQKSSNNEEDKGTLLLTMGQKNLLKATKDPTAGFTVTEEEKERAQETQFDAMEEQGLHYFGGYLGKVLKRFHGEKKCEKCDVHFEKITSETGVVEEHELFTFLKRYDDEKCTLYSPKEEILSFMQNSCLLLNYCLKKFLTAGKIQESLRKAIAQHVTCPKLCSVEMEEKLISHLVKTLFFYELKKINDKLKEEGKEGSQSKRKLKILQNK